MLEIKQKLQDAATTGNGNVATLNGWAEHISVYIRGSAGVASGAVQIETASDPDYTGTWAPLGGPITVVAGTEIIVDVAALGGAYVAIRARISTTVVGGTVTAVIVANSGT